MTQPPRYQNIEVMARLAPLLGVAPADIVGYAVIVVTTTNRVKVLSNGNPAQITDLLGTAVAEVQRRPGFTNEAPSEQPEGSG